MIGREQMRRTRDLFPEFERASCDRDAIGGPLLTDLAITPHKLRVRLRRTVLLFDFPHASLLSVVSKFAAMRAVIDRDELIPRVPFEGADAVAGEIAIRVHGSTDARFRR